MLLTDKIKVSYPITETPEERKAREKLGKPLPHYSFMISTEDSCDKKDKPKQDSI